MKPVKFTPEQREFLSSWRDELRTTELLQAVGSLRNLQDHYCCLGILLNTRNDGKWYKRRIEKEGELISEWWTWVDDGGSYHHQVLPVPVAEKVGLAHKISIDGVLLETVFIAMNDKKGMTFSEIADEIDHLLEHGTLAQETENKLDMILE